MVNTRKGDHGQIGPGAEEVIKGLRDNPSRDEDVFERYVFPAAYPNRLPALGTRGLRTKRAASVF